MCLAALVVAGCGGGGSGGSAATSVRVAGEVTAASGLAVDSDVNDPGTLAVGAGNGYASNDTLGQAQPLRAPVEVLGFVAATPTGTPGSPLETRADADDYFSAHLNAGDSVRLEIIGHNGNASDAANPDLDLTLIDADSGSVVGGCMSSARIETVSVPSDGDYAVRVTANANAAGDDASSYRLDMGPDSIPAAEQCSAPLSAAFAPDQIVARFRSGPRISGSRALERMHVARQAAGGLALLQVDERAPVTKTLAPGGRPKMSAGMRRKARTLEALKRLRRRPDVISADPNFVRQPSATPNDPLYAKQWDLDLMAMPSAWDLENATSTNPAPLVAVIDTGVYLAHPDLSGKLTAGYDFVSNCRFLSGVSSCPVSDNDATPGIDANPDDPGDNADPQLASWHGTHVSGTVAAATNNGAGVAGVGWGTRIMPLRAVGVGGGLDFDIMQAIQYAAGLATDVGVTPPSRHADVINLSLGGPNRSDTFAGVIADALDQGILIAAAAGNGDTSDATYPAAYDGVIGVSAVAPDGTRASYSNHGDYVDVAAPGGETRLGTDQGVLSTYVRVDDQGGRHPTYAYLQGTSMATPHVAGVMALMKAADPGLTPQDFDTLLRSGEITDDVGPAGRDDDTGYGILNAYKAVFQAQQLAGGAPLPGVIVPTPSRIVFDRNQSGSVELTLERLGGSGAQPVGVTSVSADAPWVTVSQSRSDSAAGTWVYAVGIDRQTLAATTTAATAEATLTVQTTEGMGPTVSVLARQGVAPGTPDAGVVYVLFVDPRSGATRYQAGPLANGGNGAYPWRIDSVSTGSYRIAAGTDLDGDGTICDPGEACGAYPVLGNVSPVSIDGSRSDLDFVVGTTRSQTAAALLSPR